MAGVAAIATDGTSRLIFAIFAVAFPMAVLVVFIWMLLKHPVNLYSPGQFTTQTSIEVFAQTLARAAQDRAAVIQSAVVEGVAEAVQAGSTGGAGVESMQEQVVEGIQRRIDESSVTVDIAEIVEDARPLQIPVTPQTRVDSLLNTVYFALAPHVRPFKYGESWVLADEKDMKPLTNMGTKWAKRRGRENDSRHLDEVGIHQGTRLVVVPPAEEKK